MSFKIFNKIIPYENINVKNHEGFTILMYSIISCKYITIKKLICNGADVNIQNNDGNTALIFAIKTYEQKISLLNSKSINLSYEKIKKIKNKINNQTHLVIKKLINYGADLNIRNNQGYTALMIACLITNNSIVEKLIHYGADINIMDNCGYTALFYTISSHEYSKDEINNYLLYQEENLIVDKLITNGANLNIKYKNGLTMLIYTIFIDNTYLAIKLINSGVNLDTQDFERKTALIYATKSGNYEIVEKLISNGANLNIKDYKGATALMYAILHFNYNYSCYKIIEKLLDYNINVNIKDNENNTPLEIAIKLYLYIKNKTNKILIHKGYNKIIKLLALEMIHQGNNVNYVLKIVKFFPDIVVKIFIVLWIIIKMNESKNYILNS
jgi:serine/threonine-protein phosphatase 6 regulatory ankyrin repeat subunit B